MVRMLWVGAHVQSPNMLITMPYFCSPHIMDALRRVTPTVQYPGRRPRVHETLALQNLLALLSGKL
jgi:hypothetical protein